MEQNRGEEEERPRPKVVDKRISARGTSDAPEVAPPTSQPQEPPPPAAPSTEQSEPPAPGPGTVWTPEQEAEAQRMAQEIAEVPSVEWVVNAAVSLANIAATKLELGHPGDAQLAIDALAGLLNSVGPRLAGAESPLRNTLSQLQMAYAERVAPPPNQPS